LTLLYTGSTYIPSGIVAIVFSTIVIMNIINGRLFIGNRPSRKAIGGALLGLLGLLVIFSSDLIEFNLKSSWIMGLFLILCATLSASLGNMTSIRNQKDGIPITQGNALAMAYGAIFLSIFALYNGSEFTFDRSASYVGSLIYLSFFGSVLAFGFYLKLLSAIGADKAAYANLLFPIVALVISVTSGEQNFEITHLIGISIVLFGNYVMLIKK